MITNLRPNSLKTHCSETQVGPILAHFWILLNKRKSMKIGRGSIARLKGYRFWQSPCANGNESVLDHVNSLGPNGFSKTLWHSGRLNNMALRPKTKWHSGQGKMGANLPRSKNSREGELAEIQKTVQKASLPILKQGPGRGRVGTQATTEKWGGGRNLH
jgi:hypothetical protein